MDKKEQFEKWRNQTIEQLAEIERKRNMLYKKICVEFDSQVLSLLFQVETSYKQLREVYENGCKMFEVEEENDNK